MTFAGLAGFSAGFLSKALLQRRHQVDHIAGRDLRRLRLVDPFALELCVDHRAQPGLVAVLQIGWIVFPGLTLNELRGELHHLRVDLHPGQVLEQLLRTVEIPVLMKRVRHQTVAHGPQRDRPLPLRDHHPRQRSLAGLRDGLPQDRIDVASQPCRQAPRNSWRRNTSGRWSRRRRTSRPSSPMNSRP